MRVRVIYDETENCLRQVGWWGHFTIEGVRKISRSKLRYCLQDNTLYTPQNEKLMAEDRRLSWMSVRVEDEYMDWIETRDEKLPFDLVGFAIRQPDIGFGSFYSLRHEETPEGRRPVTEFCAQELFDALVANPEVLVDLSKREFERLTAELFARRGFEVDLYRASKDGGIDFLAIKNEDAKPFILIAQCKHPDKAGESGKRNKVGVSLMRELYGTAAHADIPNCIMLTSSEFTSGASKFADEKPGRIELANREKLMTWLRAYRWNPDE